MSALNFALQNVATAREGGRDDFDLRIQSFNSLKAIRAVAKKTSHLQELFHDGIQPVTNTLQQRFWMVKWQGENDAGSEEEISAFPDLLQLIDESMPAHGKTQNNKDLKFHGEVHGEAQLRSTLHISGAFNVLH